MPRKKRDIRREYRRRGFDERPGKGDHTVFSHPLVRDPISVDGHEGADVKPYDEINLRKAIRELEEAQKRQGKGPGKGKQP